MKARWLSLAVMTLLVSSAHVWADDIDNNFSSLTQSSLDAFTQDFGAAIGAGSFHTGKALGFPLGFDVGAHVGAVGVQDEDGVLKDDGSTLISKWVQAEVGLPARLNVILRGGKIEDANAYGGGLRLGLLKSAVPGIPSISLTGLYTKSDHDLFDADTISANAVLSFAVPFIHPYVGVGYDHTKIDVSDDPANPAGIRGLDATEGVTRVEAGVNLSLIPFTYLTLGGGIANGEKLLHGGFGVQF